MKVILYMAVTANGFIARENDKTSWPKTEWESYRNMVKKAGNIIIGRRTYQIMKEKGEFERIENPFTVVVTHQQFKSNKNFAFAKSPKDAVKLLKKKGFTEAVVAGGGKLNSSFIKENLIDDIYLDVEPLLFGRGIKLFSEGDFEADLQLVETKKLSPDEVQLHYKVKK